MRIAVLGDIHGNLEALESVLAEIERLAPDRVVVIGDIVDGAPDSIACWRRIRDLGVPMLRGNHERYVFDFGTERASPEWSAPHFAPVRWAVQQCDATVRNEMAKLPISLRLPEAPELLFVHASSRNDHDSVFIHTPETLLETFFEGCVEPLIIRGHNHLAGFKPWKERMIVNLGSVGLPLDGHNAAQFALMEKGKKGWEVHHLAVPYDVDVTVRRFRESGYLEAGGPMARLFLREVVTATHHFVPFLRHYGHAVREGRIEVGVAIERFLKEF